MRRTGTRAFVSRALEAAAVAVVLAGVAGYLPVGLGAQAPAASSTVPNLTGIWASTGRAVTPGELPLNARGIALREAIDESLAPMYDCVPATVPAYPRRPLQLPDRAAARPGDHQVRKGRRDSHGLARGPRTPGRNEQRLRAPRVFDRPVREGAARGRDHEVHLRSGRARGQAPDDADIHAEEDGRAIFERGRQAHGGRRSWRIGSSSRNPCDSSSSSSRPRRRWWNGPSAMLNRRAHRSTTCRSIS